MFLEYWPIYRFYDISKGVSSLFSSLFRFCNLAKRDNCPVILVSVWLTGILLGVLAAIYGVDAYFPMMRPLILRRVSILAALFLHALPLTIICFCNNSPLRILLYLVAALKAFTYSFCICAVRCVFGSSAWLLFPFLLLSASVSAAASLFLSFSMAYSSYSTLLLSFHCSFCTVLIAVFLEYFWLVPFLQSLFDIT